jgi:putative chitinase
MNLKVGSTGDDVKKLQSKFGIKPDGSFGHVTESKIKEFQHLHGLKEDGIVGDITWGLIFGQHDSSGERGEEGVNGINKSILNLSALKGHIPNSVLSQIPGVAAAFGINTNLRLAHFLAQCAHESGNFKAVRENLNYSAKGLRVTFKKYFLTESVAIAYEKKPNKIGSRVYANRMGNGNELSQDGYTYRGRGFIQTTGKDNYRAFGNFIGEDCVANPELVATKYPLASAAYFFKSRGIWGICDLGSNDSVVTSVTLKVNGGKKGLPDRLAHFKKFHALLV